MKSRGRKRGVVHWILAGVAVLDGFIGQEAGAVRFEVTVSATVAFDKTDTDGDGLPDQWEARFGDGFLSTMGATSDFDGDGQSDRAEYLAGTDPADAGSHLAVTKVERMANGAIRIHWSSSPSVDPAPRTYDLHAASSTTGFPADGVIVAEGVEAPVGKQATWHELDVEPTPQRFFWIRLATPDP